MKRCKKYYSDVLTYHTGFEIFNTIPGKDYYGLYFMTEHDRLTKIELCDDFKNRDLELHFDLSELIKIEFHL